MPNQGLNKEYEVLEDRSAPTSYDAANITVTRQENTTSLEFQIAEPYDIPANGQTYQVQIQKYSIPASYEYYVVPKLEKDVFLTAQLTNWEQYDLLNARPIYFLKGLIWAKPL